MFDRIFYSAVPDFIDISINNFHWFIFNVADIFISIGVILLLTLEFFKNIMNKIIFILISLLLLTSCQSAKDAFTLKKNQPQMSF